MMPTEAMITAYLTANDAYWKEQDSLERPVGKWRNGTPREATRISLIAALAAEKQESERRLLLVKEMAENGASMGEILSIIDATK